MKRHLSFIICQLLFIIYLLSSPQSTLAQSADTTRIHNEWSSERHPSRVETVEDKVNERQLDEVVVSSHGARERVGQVQMGSEQLELRELSAMPALLGEHDVMRMVQLLPGVKAESEASSGFQVRGGTAAQNLILLDRVPVYNAGHLGGLFSAFNERALASATLYKGLIPAHEGGATAAVLDMTARTGNRSGWHGEAAVGLLSAKAAIEGPLVSDKAAIAVCARRSYMDVFLSQSKEFKNNTLYFYDVNAKLDWQLSSRDQLLLTLFNGQDHLGMKEMVDMRWSNLAASLKWVHTLGSTAWMQTTLLHSNYKTDNGVDLLGMNLTYNGHIRHSGLNYRLSWHTGRHAIEAGLQSALLDVKSAEWQQVNNHEQERRRAWENALWLSDVVRLGSRLQLSAGLRFGTFTALGGNSPYYELDEQGDVLRLFRYGSTEAVKTWTTLEPRLSLSYQPKRELSIKAGYSRTSQNIHALRSQSTSTPFDRYTLSSNLIRPETADQLSLGLYTMTADGAYDCSLEGYYRAVDHTLDYRDGKNFGSEIEIERIVLAGQGRGYGAELCLRKNHGPLTGWIAYTLSWSETQIEGINGGRWYNANNDRRHDIDIVAAYTLNTQWTFQAAWLYCSGQAFTAPSGKYEVEGNWVYYYKERNGYRAPATHRLDVSATWTKVTPKTRTKREWTFGIYNLYNRYNPYLIDFEDNDDGASTRAVQYSLFGLVPSVAFRVEF